MAALQPVGPNQLCPLHEAVSQGNPDELLSLLRDGANARLLGKQLMLAVDLGSSPQHVEVARVLLEHGADPCVVDDMHQTPLHTAVSFDRVELVQLLLQHGASVVAQDLLGWTPLTLAARLGHTNALKLMCDHADASENTMECLKSAAEVAASRQHWGCFAHVLKAGGSRAGIIWVSDRVSELPTADHSIACSALVQEWLQETASLTQQQHDLHTQRRDLAATQLGVRQLLLSALAATRQQHQHQQQALQNQAGQGDDQQHRQPCPAGRQDPSIHLGELQQHQQHQWQEQEQQQEQLVQSVYAPRHLQATSDTEPGRDGLQVGDIAAGMYGLRL